MGSGFTYFLVVEFKSEAATYAWKEALCQIDDVEIIADASQGNSPFRLITTFSYRFEGKAYQSSQYTRSEKWESEYEDLALKRKKLLNFTDGTTCFVNPENPGEAIMKREALLKGLIILFPLLFVAIGLAVMAGGVLSFKKEKDIKSGKRRESISGGATKGGPNGRVVLLLLGVIFTLVGGGLVLPLGVIPIVRALDAKNWVETPCEVIWSRVLSHKGDDSTTYSVDIFYKYEFAGQEHRSNRYTFMSGSSSGRSGKSAIVRNYRKGSEQVCFVNPDVPEQAVLQPKFTPIMLVGLIPLVFFFAGIAMLVGWVRMGRDRGNVSNTRDAKVNFYAIEDNALRGPQTLKPGGSRLAAAFGVLIFALFWNGIVSVFVWQVVAGFRRGSPEWFLTIFMIPFVLVGLGALFFFFRQLLALANPRAILTVDPGAVRPGQEGTISWTMKGNSRRISHLTIEIWGVEAATYRRGTKTRTDHKVFYCRKIMDSAEQGSSGFESGRVQFKIPQDLVPSLDFSSNRVFWQIRVNGDVPMWPDIEDQYVLEVFPASFS